MCFSAWRQKSQSLGLWKFFSRKDHILSTFWKSLKGFAYFPVSENPTAFKALRSLLGDYDKKISGWF
jgi:hypothetical protein